MNKNAKIIKYNSDRLIKKYIERLKLIEIEEKFDWKTFRYARQSGYVIW